MTAAAHVALPDRIYLLSQAKRPGEVRKILVNAALTDGWMPLIVNMNMSIFVGMIALTAGYGPVAALEFLALHLTITTLAMVIYLALQYHRTSAHGIAPAVTERLLYANDVLLMLGWGAGLALFFDPSDQSRSLMLVILLAVAGIASAALNAKTLSNLLLGRLALFGPALIFVMAQQPVLWPLLSATLVGSAAFAIGIGYAVHVQLLNESNLVLTMRDANALVSRQAQELAQSARQEQQARDQLLKEARIRESFLHSINHDLSQPLSGLDMCLYTLGRHDLPGAARAPLQAAQRSLSTAKSLIRNVSELARMQGERPAPVLGAVSASEVLGHVAQEAAALAQKKGLSLRMVPTAARVWADPDMLARVLRNLVFNAVEYTVSGRILLGVRRRGGQIGLVVADTGIGIAPEHQPRIFDAFFRPSDTAPGEQPHIGLGLAIVRELTEAMGGQVRVASVPGRGARFEVRLPAARMPPDQAGRVLLVEDRDDLRAELAQMLADLGQAVTAPTTPAEWQALPGQDLTGYDRIVLDFSILPGLTALDILRVCPPQLRRRALVISQFEDPETRALLAQMGVPFLRKPVTPAQLSAWIPEGGTQTPVRDA